MISNVGKVGVGCSSYTRNTSIHRVMKWSHDGRTTRTFILIINLCDHPVLSANQRMIPSGVPSDSSEWSHKMAVDSVSGTWFVVAGPMHCDATCATTKKKLQAVKAGWPPRARRLDTLSLRVASWQVGLLQSVFSTAPSL